MKSPQDHKIRPIRLAHPLEQRQSAHKLYNPGFPRVPLVELTEMKTNNKLPVGAAPLPVLAAVLAFLVLMHALVHLARVIDTRHHVVVAAAATAAVAVVTAVVLAVLGALAAVVLRQSSCVLCRRVG